MKTAIGITLFAALLVCDARATDVTKVPAYDQFIVVPLRVHVLTSKELDLTDGRIADDEVEKAVLKINAIWSKAGIYFGLESIVREPAAQIDRFQTLDASVGAPASWAFTRTDDDASSRDGDYDV